ncbi:MAG TPA: alkaline phosphatase family protein [Candidatus Angelobacter sp.]
MAIHFFKSAKTFTGLCTCLLLMTVSSMAAVPSSSHVVVVLEENHSYSSVIGNSAMPYLNGLASKYGLATQYFADTHPSIGNYFMLTTGAIITNDDTFSSTVSNDNIVRHLLTAGKTWKSYAESLPSVGYTGGDVYPYARHHNPFSFFSDVVNSSVQRQNLVPFGQFSNDLSNNQLPNYSFVIPNLLDDAHDGTLGQADQWLKANIDPLVNNPTFQQDGLLIIIFDEGFSTDTAGGGGQVAAVLIGPGVKKGYQSTTFYQHENMLRTTMAALGMSTFPGAAASVSDMGEMFGSSTTPPPSGSAVSIQSPTNGSTVTSAVNFSATYNKGGTAQYMKVWVDGVAGSPVFNTSTLNTSLTLSSGSHQLTVEAGDSAGTYQATVNVTVSTITPPPSTSPVSIQSPSNGAMVSSPVNFSATYNKGGTAQYMKVWVDGVAGSPVFNTSTLNATLTLGSGSHQLTVEAGDSAGAYQATVNVTVSTITSPPSTSPVSIQSPSNGATVSSPVNFSATYNKGGTAQYMKVWVDGVAGSPVFNTSTLNTTLTLSSGSHQLTVEAGDSAGTYQATVNVSVGSAPPPPSSSPVSIQSPTNGATVTSPVAFSATYNKGGTAQYMKVWVDGVAGSPVFNTSTLNTSLTMGAGSHQLVVEAGDSAGTYQAAVNVTVSSSSQPPSGTTSISNLQNLSPWQTCGACGNDGGGGIQAVYSMTQGITSPSLDGIAAKFSISGTPYTNAYWFHDNPTIPNTFTYLAYEFDLYIPNGSENAPQAIEFEVQQVLNGRLYNYSWQADYGDGLWRTFDYASKSWTPSDVPLQRFSPGVWHHILTEYHTSGTQTVEDAITIDGVRTPVSIFHDSVLSSGNEFSNAFQLDLNGNGTGYSVYVDNMKMTWQ